MCAAAVLPVSPMRGVKRRMNQLPDVTLSDVKRVLKICANEGYTKNDQGKSHDHASARLSKCGIKPSSAVQTMENLEGLRLHLLGMIEIIIICPDGQRHSIWLHKIQLEAMIVGCFKGEVLKKLFILVFLDYTLENIKLHFNGKPLDDDSASLADCGIKDGSAVQMTRKVDGG
ncbi:uncharacterized protein LOC143416501 [Maylandia zebra]|uniref:uncharacterized protein LOC143416501 n=1 Tax=Maylandia zebra TaxID=106582 RepID=UPI00403D016E